MAGRTPFAITQCWFSCFKKHNIKSPLYYYYYYYYYYFCNLKIYFIKILLDCYIISNIICTLPTQYYLHAPYPILFARSLPNTICTLPTQYYLHAPYPILFARTLPNTAIASANYYRNSILRVFLAIDKNKWILYPVNFTY